MADMLTPYEPARTLRSSLLVPIKSRLAFRNGPMFNDDFGFQGGRYDNSFPSREVTVQRVVNIVNNRNPGRPQGFNFHNDDQWCNNGPQRFRNSPDCHWENDFQDFRGFHGDDGSYIEPQYSHDDLRHHLSSRGRPGPYFRKRGGFNGNFSSREDIDAFRASSGKMMKSRPREKKRAKPHPEKPPAAPESQPKKTTPKAASAAAPESAAGAPSCKDKKPVPVQAAASSSTPKETPPGMAPKSGSPAKDSTVVPAHATGGDVKEPVLEPCCTAGSAAKDATVVPSLTFRRTVEEPQSSEAAEEALSAPPKTEGEPEPTPVHDFKARRAEAIRTKALEIEKVYRQDCETFCSVVKLLVDKEPSLETLLQAPLDKNLQEIKQQCLEELRQFVKELDEQCGSA
ncbi:uncharacterized protein ACB057_005893 [Neosynchiropus ocellatus]